MSCERPNISDHRIADRRHIFEILCSDQDDNHVDAPAMNFGARTEPNLTQV